MTRCGSVRVKERSRRAGTAQRIKGNLSRDDGFDGIDIDSDGVGDDFFEYTYDAENRLSEVNYDYDGDGNNLTLMAQYNYDALGRRIEYIDAVRDVTTRYYYDGQNVIAEYNESGALSRTYVHGTQYIDERAVMRDHTEPQDHYYLLKELYTVAGLAGANGGLEEAYTYDTYGNATIHAWPAEDLDRDGDVDQDDEDWIGTITTADGTATDYPFADIDLDGDVDGTDEYWVAVNCVLTPTAMTYSSLDNPYFFTGRTTDTLHADDDQVENDANFHRLQDNRNRMYDPKHGRWLQRDPLGVRPDASRGKIDPHKQYTDGMGLYEYVRSNPVAMRDPSGKLSIGKNYAKSCAYAQGYMMPSLVLKSQCSSASFEKGRKLANEVLSEAGPCRDWMNSHGCGGGQVAHIDCCPNCYQMLKCVVKNADAYVTIWSNTMVICPNLSYADPVTIASLLIHEAIHTCGAWQNEATANEGQLVCTTQIYMP